MIYVDHLVVNMVLTENIESGKCRKNMKRGKSRNDLYTEWVFIGETVIFQILSYR